MLTSSGKVLPRGGSNPRRCIKQDSEPNTLPTSCFCPPDRGSLLTISGRVIPVTSQLLFWWLSWHTPGCFRSALRLVSLVSMYCVGWDSEYDLRVLSQRGSAYNWRSRFIPKIHFAFFWDVKLPRKETNMALFWVGRRVVFVCYLFAWLAGYF